MIITGFKLGSSFLKNLYSPEDSLGAVGDDLDILNDKTDDKEVDDKEEEEDKEEVEEDKKEDKTDEDEDKEKDEDDEEKEDEDEEVDEEEEEYNEADQLASVKDIKKDFPDFFKKHPEVRAAIFRDQRFSEIIGTPEDAEQAVTRSNALAAIEKDLMVDGDPSNLLAAIKKDTPDAYEKVVYNLLPYLQKNDKETYLELAAVPIKQLLRNAWVEGKGKETDLGRAAAYIHNFFFRNTNFDEKVPAESGKTEEKTKAQKDYEARLAELDQKEYDGFKSSVDQSYINKMDNFIREALDKDDRLTDYVRKTIINDTLTAIVKQLSKDTQYNAKMSSLWKQAKGAKFSNDFKSRIVDTALARAKSLVPGIRTRLISEALGKAKKAKGDDEKDKKSFKPKPKVHQEERSRNRTPDRPKFKSDLDILREA